MKPAGVVMLTDSECTISAVEKTTSSLKPFFHNRVSELHENISMMKNICPVEDLLHVSGLLNPADLATRDTTKAVDIGPASFWFLGPSFVGLRRDLWPASRSFLDKPERTGEDVPVEEIRCRKTVISALMRGAVKGTDSGELMPGPLESCEKGFGLL